MPTGLQHIPFRSALIVDDHPLYCDALAMTLRAVAGIDAVEMSGRLDTALARLDAADAPDIIVLDLNLPDVNGLDGLIRLRQAAGDVPVLVVSSMAENRVIRSCLAAGAAGFVPKHAGPEDFAAALRVLSQGLRYVPEGFDAAPDAAPGPRDEVIGRLALLTRQQARILQLICEGMLNKQIAWELSIAETTVKAHVTAIMRKLGVQSRTQAVLLARETHFESLMPEGG
jgi:DNA-binding NarL/FixJ family response regulator